MEGGGGERRVNEPSRGRVGVAHLIWSVHLSAEVSVKSGGAGPHGATRGERTIEVSLSLRRAHVLQGAPLGHMGCFCAALVFRALASPPPFSVTRSGGGGATQCFGFTTCLCFMVLVSPGPER